MDRLKIQRRKRFGIQALWTLVTNANFTGFLDGKLYKGPLKQFCVPGLNCYSCPGALGSCPIGAMQALAGSPDYALSLLVLGFLMVVGGLGGRLVCGFLCPFGWFQDLLHRIPFPKKFSTRRFRPLTWLKYGVLVVFVFLLPNLMVNVLGMGDPTFCKYLCPQGILEGALPLAAVSENTRAALGALFQWKFALLLAVVLLSVMVSRPFCKYRWAPSMRSSISSHCTGCVFCRRSVSTAASALRFARWTAIPPGTPTRWSASAAGSVWQSVRPGRCRSRRSVQASRTKPLLTKVWSSDIPVKNRKTGRISSFRFLLYCAAISRLPW